MKVTNLSASTFVKNERYFEPGVEVEVDGDEAEKFKNDDTVKQWVNAGLLEVEGMGSKKSDAKETSGLKSSEDATTTSDAGKTTTLKSSEKAKS